MEAVRGLLVVWLSASLVPTALADVTQSMRQETYVAEARAGVSLLTALNAASPIREGGRIFHGYTRWFVDWRFWWHDGATGCSITSVQTTLDIKVTLPQLASTDAALSQRFSTYIAALRRHEQGHVDLAQAAAREIDAGLQRLPPMASCRVLETTANRFAHARLDAARSEERRYDRETGNGRAQGAWLER